MLKKFLASILAPIIADELQNAIVRIVDIETSINSSLADIKDEMDDIRHSVDEIDPYNLGSSIGEYISIDERQIAREISSEMEEFNSDNWDDLWKSLTTVENQLKEIMKALNIQTDNQ